MEDYKFIISRVSSRVLGDIAHMYETAEITEEACQLEGDMCECGCYNGGMSSIMGYVCRIKNKNIKIHLYDSFEGIPYPTKEDLDIPGHPEGVTRTGELKSTGVSVANFETLNLMLGASGYPRENFIVNKGWVQHTIPETLYNIEKLSFLRIDVDLYVPTKLSLDLLYDKVVSGGYVLVHDMIPGCEQAVREFILKHPEIKLQYCRNGGGYRWKKE
jgi:O-methyltransferase